MSKNKPDKCSVCGLALLSDGTCIAKLTTSRKEALLVDKSISDIYTSIKHIKDLVAEQKRNIFFSDIHSQRESSEGLQEALLKLHALIGKEFGE